MAEDDVSSRGGGGDGVVMFVIPSARGDEVAGAHGPGTTWR
ncbi:MAG TPA: hypothetical protein VFU51_07920 [Gaiellaceae bacterium]|nr:hypothetical protein [Gaiellaceae bacterium]